MKALPTSAHQDAIDFQNDQISVLRREQMIDSSQTSVEQALAVPYYGQLLQDAKLASMTVAAFHELPCFRVHTDPYGSYYLVRKLVLAGRYQNEPLKHALLSALGGKRTTKETIFSHVNLCNFICNYAQDLEPGVAHGVWIPEEESDIEDESEDGEDEADECDDQSDEDEDGSGEDEGDESDGPEDVFAPRPSYDGLPPEWKYALEVLEAARGDRMYRTRGLRKAILKKK